MKKRTLNRRNALKWLGKSIAGILVSISAWPGKTLAGKGASAGAGSAMSNGFNPNAHRWAMAININKCIGCGMCADACKTENKVIREPFYFRTWVERYIMRKPEPGSGALRGEIIVDSPNGGIDGFPPTKIPSDEVLKSFFVPKLCNHCASSPCVQVCPVGATFDSPDGVALVDGTYCIGCGFCIQACPYGCRFMNPITKTAEKCTFCYHRVTRGLKPACVEVCPTGTRLFGDLKETNGDNPLRQFIRDNNVLVLKPHLGTHPRVLYAGLDAEVR